MCPKTVQVKDAKGLRHDVDVEILGVEETWRTPSILLATDRVNHGKAIFSQVHLEADPSQFEADEGKYAALKNSDGQRLEILGHLLSTHLNVEVKGGLHAEEVKYSPGYLLSDKAERKESLIRVIESKSDASGVLASGAMNICLVMEGHRVVPEATERFLPLLLKDSGSSDFDSSLYFEVSERFD